MPRRDPFLCGRSTFSSSPQEPLTWWHYTIETLVVSCLFSGSASPAFSSAYKAMPRITKSQKLGKTRSGKTVTAVNQPRPRTHAFTGCGNCRDRHVKCGLETPACNNCARLKLNCEGYVRKYSWIPAKFGRSCNLKDAEDVDEAQSSRRVLFSGHDCSSKGRKFSHD